MTDPAKLDQFHSNPWHGLSPGIDSPCPVQVSIEISPFDLVECGINNLDSQYKQSGFLSLPLEEMGVDLCQPYQAHDLLTDARYLWHGARNYVELNPQTVPAHIFVIRRKVRTEHDFDYYL